MRKVFSGNDGDGMNSAVQQLIIEVVLYPARFCLFLRSAGFSWKLGCWSSFLRFTIVRYNSNRGTHLISSFPYKAFPVRKTSSHLHLNSIWT